MAEARVISVPTPVTDFYQVRVVENQEMVSCERTELMDPDQTLGVDTAHLPSGLDSDDEEDPFSPTLPDWMRVGGKVTMLVNEKRYKGTLDLDEDNDWVFTVRNRTGQIALEHGLYDLPYSWRTRMIEESLVIGHHSASPDDTPQYPQEPNSAAARHVSASSLHEPNPGTLRKALNPKFADHKVWLESY